MTYFIFIFYILKFLLAHQETYYLEAKGKIKVKNFQKFYKFKNFSKHCINH